MSLFDDAADELAARMDSDASDDEPIPTGGNAKVKQRSTAVSLAGETKTIERPETSQGGDDTWLSGANRYGWPRGREAIDARRISQTSAMQSIANAITSQLTGGDIVFESDDDQVDSAEADLQALLRDVLTGPHLMDDDLDDLIAAAVDDMLGPGNAYWQLLAAEDESLPVASLVPLDALTVRHNYDRHGYPKDPPYYQAPNAFGGNQGLPSLGSVDAVALQASNLAVMRYPFGRKSHQVYPRSPSLQVREWLEHLVDSTTHHRRYYSDNQVPPGMIQVLNATDTTLTDIRKRVEDAKGDPRKAPIVGGEGQAMWVEMGGQSVNLDVIQEQEWFYQLCLGAVGLGKAEVGLIEDVNRANGEIEASRVFKRVTGPFAAQFANAFTHIARQFDVYNALDQPFDIRLAFTDPREERAREQRLREMFQSGGLTLREYVRRRGDGDLADNEERYTVTIDGETVDYGAHPRWVARELLAEARGADRPAADEDR